MRGRRCSADRRSKHRVQARRVQVSESARLDLEAIVPVSPAYPLHDIASYSERAGLPLFDDVPVLVEHQPRIVEELGRAVPQVDAVAARCGDSPAVATCKEGILDDPDMADRGLQQHLQ